MQCVQANACLDHVWQGRPCAAQVTEWLQRVAGAIDGLSRLQRRWWGRGTRVRWCKQGGAQVLPACSLHDAQALARSGTAAAGRLVDPHRSDTRAQPCTLCGMGEVVRGVGPSSGGGSGTGGTGGSTEAPTHPSSAPPVVGLMGACRYMPSHLWVLPVQGDHCSAGGRYCSRGGSAGAGRCECHPVACLAPSPTPAALLALLASLQQQWRPVAAAAAAAAAAAGSCSSARPPTDSSQAGALDMKPLQVGWTSHCLLINTG